MMDFLKVYRLSNGFRLWQAKPKGGAFQMYRFTPSKARSNLLSESNMVVFAATQSK
jgi:hypothetical protein